MTKREVPPTLGDGTQLHENFAAALKAIGDHIKASEMTGDEGNPPAVNLRVRLDRVGEIEAQIGRTRSSERSMSRVASSLLTMPLTSATDGAARVKKAKELLGAGNSYAKGCSGFVCDVLGIPWESANDLMGGSPISAGDNNAYTGLQPGDIAGWKSSAGSGHVTVYVGEDGMQFVDVRTEGQTPRHLTGYGMNRPLFKSAIF